MLTFRIIAVVSNKPVVEVAQPSLFYLSMAVNLWTVLTAVLLALDWIGRNCLKCHALGFSFAFVGRLRCLFVQALL